MPTAGERITVVESDLKLICRSVDDLCKELAADRTDRKSRDEKVSNTLYGKDTQNPGLIVEVDRLKIFRKRVSGHMNWLWGALAAAIAASVGSLVARAMGVF